jgi:hypothetical protein
MYRCLLRFPLATLISLSALAEDYAYEQAPIRYSSTTPKDAAHALGEKLRQGQVDINRRDAWTILQSLLKELIIPLESQVMVFSKTSKQNDLIGPHKPRVIYFTDDAYVGYSVGGSLEVSAIDPHLGPVFYLLNPHVETTQPLTFQREESCLSCHGGSFTPGVPGVLVRSVFPGPEGHPIMSQGSTVVDTTTPFSDRWGGWYVTGSHGKHRHRGNITVLERPDASCEMPFEKGANVNDLSAFFDISRYPRSHSDIVALMVLEHQTSTQNVLTRANHTALRAMHMQICLQKELGEPVLNQPVGTARRIIDHCAEDVLRTLLFHQEAALPKGGIEGAEDFQNAFSAHARRASDGRSLKDFQLRSRLFKYRCSYMIHGLTFQHLEPHLKQTVLCQLERILTQNEPTPTYAYLGRAEREHILRILRETGVLSSS